MHTRISAIILFLGVTLGAFGAHGLEDKLTLERLEVWQTAVFYHLVHGLALFVMAWGAARPPKGPWLSLAIGILLFSGSLYVLCLTGVTKFGAITPLGGIAFLVGWAWLAIQPSRSVPS